MTRKTLTTLIETRHIQRLFRGVFQPSSIPDTTMNRCEAIKLVMRPFDVVCDRTAAWLHGVDTFSYRELEILPPIDTIVLRHNTRTRRHECRGGERDLRPVDVYMLNEVRVTTPTRTALDLGCHLHERDALAALDGFMRVCGVTRADLDEQLPRYRGRRGVVQLRRLIPLASPLAESPGESWTRMAIIQAGLPAPEIQVWIVLDGDLHFRLDLGYPKHKVAVEYDGKEFHDSPEYREADERRRELLRRDGWTVVVVRKTSFAPDALAFWISELATALGL
jgi:hypothetical protein